MATHCIFLKIGFLFQKKNRTENENVVAKELYK